MRFHLIKGLQIRRQLGLAIPYGPTERRTYRARNRRTGVTPGITGDVSNGFDLGLGKRSCMLFISDSPVESVGGLRLSTELSATTKSYSINSSHNHDIYSSRTTFDES